MRDARLILAVDAASSGASDTNRTCDPPLRRGMLYPLSYGGPNYNACYRKLFA